MNHNKIRIIRKKIGSLDYRGTLSFLGGCARSFLELFGVSFACYDVDDAERLTIDSEIPRKETTFDKDDIDNFVEAVDAGLDPAVMTRVRDILGDSCGGNINSLLMVGCM